MEKKFDENKFTKFLKRRGKTLVDSSRKDFDEYLEQHPLEKKWIERWNREEKEQYAIDDREMWDYINEMEERDEEYEMSKVRTLYHGQYGGMDYYHRMVFDANLDLHTHKNKKI